MDNWNSTNPDDWTRRFGLVALPYFGQNRRDVPDGKHFMMQDGDAASFAFHISKKPQDLIASREPLRWAWSSHVRAAVILDPASMTATTRVWDDPSFHTTRVVKSESAAGELIRELEEMTRPVTSVAGPNVIESTLEVFALLRAALEERKGTALDVVVAFNAALLVAEKWRESPDRIPDVELRDAVATLRKRRHPGFEAQLSNSRVDEYPLGQFVRILLDQKQAGAPYHLDPYLLIRHASGLLNQEAHRLLSEPAKPPHTLFPALPSRPEGRREPAPSFVVHTPPWLARAIVEFGLQYREWSPNDPIDVLDPACGSGIFLIETAREMERNTKSRLRLRGMDISPIAGLMTEFCLGEAGHALAAVSVSQSIRSDVNSLKEKDWGEPDLILMNPPYKAWESLGSDRDIVRDALGDDMIGRPDLYLAFIARSARALKPGGVLAFVVPSAFFNVQAAARIRARLAAGDFRVRVLAVLRGFETFDGKLVEAAVIVVSKSVKDLPVRVVIAERGQAERAIRLARAPGLSRTVSRAGIELFTIPPDSLGSDPWILDRQEDLQFAASLKSQAATTVKDFFRVRLGMRGIGAKQHEKILLLSEDDYKRLIRTSAERRFFRPTADRIENGRIQPAGYVFYPYSEDGKPLFDDETAVKNALPDFYEHILQPAQKPLVERRTSYRKWWEPSRPVATWLAAHAPRIVSQEHGKKGNFAFDDTGRYAVVGGHGWCWRSKTPATADTWFAYLALFNSRVFERLLGVYCPRIQGTQLKLAWRYVKSITLPDLSRNNNTLAMLGTQIHAGESVNDDALDAAVLAAYRSPTDDRQSPAAVTFAKLASQWKKETRHLSSAMRIAAHPAYREIVNMGKDALPLILADLRRKPDHWFVALHEITGINPVPTESEGYVEKMARAWISWGKQEGLIP